MKRLNLLLLVVGGVTQTHLLLGLFLQEAISEDDIDESFRSMFAQLSGDVSPHPHGLVWCGVKL